MSDLNINNFEQEVLKSDKPVLVRFGVDTGCGYCDKYKPVFEAFEKKHPEIKCITVSKPTLRDSQSELEGEYDVKSYPTTIAFLNGEMTGKVSGIKKESELLELFKTMQNVSIEELLTTQADLEEQRAKEKKALLMTNITLSKINAELERRATAPATSPSPVAPVVIPPTCEDECKETCKDSADVECHQNCMNHCHPVERDVLIASLKNIK